MHSGKRSKTGRDAGVTAGYEWNMRQRGHVAAEQLDVVREGTSVSLSRQLKQFCSAGVPWGG